MAARQTLDVFGRKGCYIKIIRFLGAVSCILVGALLIMTAFPNLFAILKILKRIVPVFVLVGIMLVLFPLIVRWHKPKSRVAKKIYRLFWPIAICCMVAVCWMAVSFTAIAVAGWGSTPPTDATVVVLGEGSSDGVPSFNQAVGIAAAGNYLRMHSSTVCIASGGVATATQPADATIIRDKLVSEYGIAPGRIFVEAQSRTTYENMMFSEKIIKEHGLSHKIAIAAPSFHLLRAEMLAHRVGLMPYGLPGKVSLEKQWPNYFRELLAFPKSLILDRNGISHPEI